MLRDELEEQFDQYGVQFNAEILDKCVELCTQYEIVDASTFVDEWMAYTVSKLGGADPTIDTICDMARNELDQKSQKTAKNKLDENDDGGIKIYGNELDDDMDDDILGSYITSTSPNKPSSKRIGSNQSTTKTKTLFTPVSYSPLSTTPSRKANDEAGKALCTFGFSALVKNCKWTQYRSGNIQITLSGIGTGSYMSLDTLYMTDSMSTRAALEGEQVYKLGEDIFEHLKSTGFNVDADTDVLDLQHCDVPCLDVIRCLGRIIIEDEQIEKYNIYMIGMDETTLRKVRLDFGKCKNYSVFPGQVVLVEGHNIRGDTLFVDRIMSATNIISSPAPKLSVPLSIVITSGPYTADTDLAYQPLSDLVKYCSENPPDILIITGPILTSTNTAIGQMAERFDRHFDRIITDMIENLNPNTHIVIASSFEDVNSTYIYPTHPYRFKRGMQNLHLVPDPCIIDVNGIHIGITSTDTIGHLSACEQTDTGNIDKIKRAVNYMFHQKSFYPIRPPKIPLDVGLATKYASLNVAPNVLILPSDIMEFIRDYNNCLCINPGRVCGKRAGTFARIVLHPPAEEEKEKKLFKYVAGQVIKI